MSISFSKVRCHNPSFLRSSLHSCSATNSEKGWYNPVLLQQCVLRPVTVIDRRIRLRKKTNQVLLWVNSWGNLEVFLVWYCLDFPKMQTVAGPLPILKPLVNITGSLRLSSPLSRRACSWNTVCVNRLHSCMPCHTN